MQVACLVNIGSGDPTIHPLTEQKGAEELGELLRSCQLVADDVASQCHDLGSFFFRFSVSSGLGQESHFIENDISRVKGLTMAYLSSDEMSTRLNNLDERMQERFGAVCIERLGSVAGKDGESRVAARLTILEEHLNGAIFRNLKKWLKPLHQTSKLDANIRARSGTTCQWLLENNTFLRWMERHGLFWIRGLMGTGKTVMSSFVVETLLARDNVYVAYYYFDFSNPTTLSEESLLRSLKHNEGGLQPQLTTLQATLNELVTVSKKPVFIVIDALDELPPVQRKYVFQFLLTFSALKDVSRTHVMVTSREEVDIHRALTGKVDFELRVQGDLVRQDIAAFVDRELGAKKWTFWPRAAIELARHLLNERADGQFRMVACQVDILQQVKTYEHLQQSLHSLPKTLGETYDYILGQIPEHLRGQAYRLFSILSFALDSISIAELSALLAVELYDEEDPTLLPIFREGNQFIDPLDVIDLGASLVSPIDNDGQTFLHLAHTSVKEHFLSSNEAWFSLRDDLAHSIIARSCIALLVHFRVPEQEDENNEGKDNEDTEDEDDEDVSEVEDEDKMEDKYDFLFCYAQDKWFSHVLPNGPPQLLHQQEHLYTFFPWSYILDNDEDEDEFEYKAAKTKSSLASAAFLGLLDLLKTFLTSRLWGGGDLAHALIATFSSKRAQSIRMQCFHALLTSGVDVNAFTDTGSPLHHASEIGDLEFVQALTEKGADVNASRGRHGSVLQAGAFGGSLEVVRFLVENRADVNAKGGEHGTALHTASYACSVEIVRFLVENGADVNARGGPYGSALQTASYASSRNLDNVRFLIENGADVNAVGGKYGTALQAAACEGNLEIVSFLIEKGADVNTEGGHYGTALQAASHQTPRHLEIMRLLVEKGADMNARGKFYSSALQIGARIGNLEVIRFLVENGADVNARGGLDGSALQIGASIGNLDIVRLLVENGADVNAEEGMDESALQAGANQGELGIVRFLVENGADVNAKAGPYGSALHTSVCRGDLEIVRVLVENGADMNMTEGRYGSALQTGAYYGKLQIAHFLVEIGADVNAGGGFYGQALQAGACNGELDIVRFLVENGADVNAGGGLYGSALQGGASSGNLEIVRFLIENGACVNAGGGNYGSALQAGAYSGGLEIVRFLVANGADVNSGGGRYGSALQAGAYSGKLEIVRFLVDNGAYVGAGGGEYGSALQAGAHCGKLGIVRFLVENGAYVNATGGVHKTALDAAQSSFNRKFSVEKHDVMRFLRSCGSKTWEEMIDLDNDMWKDVAACGQFLEFCASRAREQISSLGNDSWEDTQTWKDI
ncbi:ankyrin repeat-containing domain protein [Flagelloscypha sp. PMI_526]|nr:ankyrin repeat-containing domain protein [Flagelloscypha sp. PMI_526]